MTIITVNTVKYPRKLEFWKVEFLCQYSETLFCTKSTV